MISYSKLSPAQDRWRSLVEYFYPEIYKLGKITHQELIMAHAKFMSLRTKDKKYTIGWPIWLISNNAISRGVYSIPRATDQVSAEVKDHSSEAKTYEDELSSFNVK